jgi:membrane protein insertase Oxa1/YidC/SpoIIIJ
MASAVVFFKGTYQYGQGAWSAWFWLFFIGVIPLSVIFTWIFNNTRRSTLAVMLFHFMVVFTDELLNLTARTNLYSTLLWILAAIVVTFAWGAKTFTRNHATGNELQL